MSRPAAESFSRNAAPLVTFVLFALAGTAAAGPAWLDASLAEGEAIVVYLHHSGWLVRTAGHVLLFDPVRAQGRDILEPAHVAPADLAGHPVVIFVSHAHGDHWDPGVLDLERQLDAASFVLGWKLDSTQRHVQLGAERLETRVAELTVYNVYHEFDGIPESAFLVNVDGLWLYHAGDHSHPQAAAHETFAGNLAYLASLTDTLDLLFTPTWGGELFAISKLRPRVVLPMHDGGRERQYARWAARSDVAALGFQVGAADAPGHCFLYRGGKLVDCP